MPVNIDQMDCTSRQKNLARTDKSNPTPDISRAEFIIDQSILRSIREEDEEYYSSGNQGYF